jgi:hypothetical protein
MPKWYVEERRTPRIEINASGRLILVSPRLRLKDNVSCTVVNVSADGALIEASSGVGADEFYLEIDSQPGKLQSCRVVRRQGGNRIGVKFI